MASSAGRGLRLECKVVVPKQFISQPFPPPNGQLERTRYKEAYEAFWWNCVAVMADDMDALCPSLASGTAAASYGAADGSMAATNGIANLVKIYGVSKVQAYLKKLASPPSKVTAMLHGYFNGKPYAEPRAPGNRN